MSKVTTGSMFDTIAHAVPCKDTTAISFQWPSISMNVKYFKQINWSSNFELLFVGRSFEMICWNTLLERTVETNYWNELLRRTIESSSQMEFSQQIFFYFKMFSKFRKIKKIPKNQANLEKSRNFLKIE